jgi:hypothetical protein
MITPLDALAEALIRAGDYNPAAEAAPEAVLWCDEKSEFAPLLPALRARLPQLLTLGSIDAASRQGPAVWLRVAAARVLPEVAWPPTEVAIVYLPGVGREVLRAAEDCPELLKPLVWLAVAGSFFGHVNGKDWTLRAFLTSGRGLLKLDIPDEPATRTALGHAAARLFATPLEQLRGQQLDADALTALLAPDLAADALDWLEHGLAGAEPGRLAAFGTQARRRLKFDPAKESRHDGAVRLAAREGKWADVWERFAATNGAGHPQVVKLLEALEPPGDLFADRRTYPRANRQSEEELRAALLKLADLPQDKADARVLELDKEHGARRGTIWARRGEAPLACALAHLVRIVETTVLPPHDATALATEYFERGWQADQAVLDALVAAPLAADRKVIAAALHAIYLPWLEHGATALQDLAQAGKVPFAQAGKPGKGDALVFVDGLRMDLARGLQRLLEGEGAKASLGWVWSGFPTVTATCKPLVSPAATSMGTPAVAGELYAVTDEGKAARKPVLDKAIEAAGYTMAEALLPAGKLWTEAGTFDTLGHASGAGMAGQLATALRDAADRVLQLARAGRKVRVVTDHGWLLLPGGLEKAPLDSGLVEPDGKRSRCALVKEGATTSYLRLPWTWNPEIRVAVPTGARAFLAGQEYAHGGVSPQECVLPVIEVAPMTAATTVTITAAVWQGLRLRVTVAGGADLNVDLKQGASSSGPSCLKGIRVLDESGKTSVLVSDIHEGQTATLVVLDEAGAVVASRQLVVGKAEA